MAKIIGDVPVPKKIPGFVHYHLRDVPERILRAKSGITKDNYKQKRYQKSRENASEFGALSAMCKKFREPLNDVFPVANRNALCNRFTSKMGSLLSFDVLSETGNRNLAAAFSFLETRQELVGYEFNLSAPLPHLSRPYISFDRNGTLILNASSFVSELTFPIGADWVAVQMHRYLFDFTIGVGVLCSSECLFLNRFTTLEGAALSCSSAALEDGILFTLLALKFYTFEEGCYVSVVPDLGTIASILGCEK